MRKITGLFLFIVFSSVLASSPQTYHYAAIVDAGSSGTRLHVFQWSQNKTGDKSNITEISSKKITPGLTQIPLNQEAINDYLSKLEFDSNRSGIPLYFYSTAGMRFMPMSIQKQYYAMVAAFFTNHAKFNLKEAKTITGREEGIFGWLAVNYYRGALTNTKIKPSAVIDAGGASTQISFPLVNDLTVRPSDIVDIDMYHHHFKIFTHSFLGLGQNESAHQFLNISSCFPYGYVIPNGDEGKGDISECTLHAQLLINQVHHVRDLVYPILEKAGKQHWEIIGGLQTMMMQPVYEFKHQNTATLEELFLQSNDRICTQNWNELQNKYKNNPYIYNYCFLASHYYALLHDGYGLNATVLLKYKSKEGIADWTVGALLFKVK